MEVWTSNTNSAEKGSEGKISWQFCFHFYTRTNGTRRETRAGTSVAFPWLENPMELQSVACANTLASLLLCALSSILCIEHSVRRYYLACCRQAASSAGVCRNLHKKKSVIILIDVTRIQILMNTAMSSPLPHRAPTNKTNSQQSTLLLFSLWCGREIAMNFVNYVEWWKVGATVVDCHINILLSASSSSSSNCCRPHFVRALHTFPDHTPKKRSERNLFTVGPLEYSIEMSSFIHCRRASKHLTVCSE